MNYNNKSSFFKSIKVEKDPDIDKLLKIQDELEKKGITIQNVYELTKDLSMKQKQKLKELYKTQIKEFELNIEKCKNKIISIKKENMI